MDDRTCEPKKDDIVKRLMDKYPPEIEKTTIAKIYKRGGKIDIEYTNLEDSSMCELYGFLDCLLMKYREGILDDMYKDR